MSQRISSVTAHVTRSAAWSYLSAPPRTQAQPEPMHPVSAAPAVFFQRPNTCSMEQPSLRCVCASSRDMTTNVYFSFRRSEHLKHAILLLISQVAPGNVNSTPIDGL